MDEEIVFRYLSGDVTKEEEHTIELWLNKGEANLNLFNRWKEVWILSSKHQAPTVDTEKAWSAINEKTKAQGKLVFLSEKTSISKSKQFYTNTSVAAASVAAASVAILLLLGIGFWFGQNDSVDWTTTTLTEQRTLSDGSKVWLAANSQLTYPEKFAATRKVWLQGKAFFEVAENTSKPFLVNGNKTQIKVLGTQFLATNSADKEEVFLQSGKVAYYPTSKESEKVILTPNEQATFDITTNQLQKSIEFDPNLLAWKTQKLVFNETSLQEVFPLLEEVYHIKIEVEKEYYAQCLVTATFDQEPVENIWELLETIFQIEIHQINDHTYAIKGKSCITN